MPNWIHNAVIYQIFIDRFAGYAPNADDSRPEWCGGNLAGITSKLDYLADLGATALWATPFLKAADYHGYSTVDLYQVDPHFGTLADAKKLVQECHKRGIKFILDFTANHVSEYHPFFIEAKRDQKSPYRDWFYFDPKNPDTYLTFLQFTTLPKINLDFGPAREHVIGSALHWISELDIDGIRLDHAVGPSLDFWSEFGRRCRELKQDIVLLGEVAFFGVKPIDLKTFLLPSARRIYWSNKMLIGDPFAAAVKEYVGILDGCFDFGFRETMDRFAKDELDESQVRKRLAKHYRRLPAKYILPTFLDNQDYSRYLYLANQSYDKLKAALTIQFSFPHPKVIYYGSEVGMTHKDVVVQNSGWAGDLPTRRKMNWNPNAKEQELLGFYKELIAKSKA